MIFCKRFIMNNEFALSGYERQQQLLQFIEQWQRVSVDQICNQFSVSKATARRDLEILARNGKVQRIHGGAIALHNAPPEPPFSLRSSEQTEEKRRIGQTAASLIADGETIFLGSGTTVLEVANHLRSHHRLTVITNSLLVLNVLTGIQDISIIGLGGMLRTSEMSFIGHITEQALAELRADKVILGIRAIDLEHGLTNDYLPETQTDRAILNIGRQVILVADHTKCERVATAFVAPLTAMDTFVTDVGTSPDFIAALTAQGVHVLAV
jgi:DeoR/GlpR family transcriptional regulator of sugar metabolism